MCTGTDAVGIVCPLGYPTADHRLGDRRHHQAEYGKAGTLSCSSLSYDGEAPPKWGDLARVGGDDSSRVKVIYHPDIELTL